MVRGRPRRFADHAPQRRHPGRLLPRLGRTVAQRSWLLSFSAIPDFSCPPPCRPLQPFRGARGLVSLASSRLGRELQRLFDNSRFSTRLEGIPPSRWPLSPTGTNGYV